MIGAEHLKMSSNIVNLAMKSEELTVLNLYLPRFTYHVCTISDHFKYNANDCRLNIFSGRHKPVTS